jgi:hypothetical protein
VRVIVWLNYFIMDGSVSYVGECVKSAVELFCE